jgi:MraZ protein
MSQIPAPILGLHHKKLDKFDRIVLPRNICKALGEGKPVVMVPWLDRSIALFNAQEFRKMTDRFCGNRRKRFRADRRMLIRYLGSYASKASYDRQGRLAIPETLRKWAYIGTDVTILGTFDMAEIFSTPVYEKMMEEGKLNFDRALEEALCEEEFGEEEAGESAPEEDLEFELGTEEGPESNP